MSEEAEHSSVAEPSQLIKLPVRLNNVKFFYATHDYRGLSCKCCKKHQNKARKI